jgi:hypothetical protein
LPVSSLSSELDERLDDLFEPSDELVERLDDLFEPPDDLDERLEEVDGSSNGPPDGRSGSWEVETPRRLVTR